MRAVGVDSVAVTRIDGMYFIASDFRRKSAFPLKGSTAEVLQKELRTLDFVWRDDDGAEVLCHWNAFTYFQGDMLAHAGIVRWSGVVAAIPWRTRRHIAAGIDGFVRQLEPLARTPYLLCPIGMDFNDPIDRLPELLHRYNDERFGSTGTWALLAGMDDYFELVGHHSARLPVLSVDPNPYWMGFYASRPELKQRSTRLTRDTSPCRSALRVEAREASSRSGAPRRVAQPGADEPPRRDHRDVPGSHLPRGTPRLARQRRGRRRPGAGALVDDEAPRPRSEQSQAGRGRAAPAGEERELHLQTAHHRLTFSKERGGCLTSLVLDGEEQLRGLGLDLVAYADDGGLWRLGHEYRGGSFRVVDAASRRPARIELTQTDDALRVVIESDLRGKRFTRTITCSSDRPVHRHLRRRLCRAPSQRHVPFRDGRQ